MRSATSLLTFSAMLAASFSISFCFSIISSSLALRAFKSSSSLARHSMRFLMRSISGSSAMVSAKP